MENGWRDEDEERGSRLFTLLVGDPEPPVGKDVRHLNHIDKDGSRKVIRAAARYLGAVW